jgi:hypothetical protein
MKMKGLRGKIFGMQRFQTKWVFSWRAPKDNLATKGNKFRRNLELDSTCKVCGAESETSYHATVPCTKARALRTDEETMGSSSRRDGYPFLQILVKTERDWSYGKCC